MNNDVAWLFLAFLGELIENRINLGIKLTNNQGLLSQDTVAKEKK